MNTQTSAVTQVLTLQNIANWKKKELTDLAIASVEEVAENGEDTLSLLALAAKLEHFAGEVKKAAKERGVTDLAKYDRGGVAKQGVKLSLKETGVKYDYSNDRVWSMRDEDVRVYTSLRKDWEELLKKLPPSGMVLTDPQTGEEYKAYPPLKTATESIQAVIL